MTPDGISTEDWDNVFEAGAAITHASGMEDEVLREHYQMRLFDLLDELEAKYGRLPSILATRADFSDDPKEAIPLLQEALSIATDDLSQRLTLQSLLHLLIENGGQTEIIAQYMTRLTELTPQEGDKSDRDELSSLQDDFRRKLEGRL